MAIVHINDTSTGAAQATINMLLSQFPRKHKCLGLIIQYGYPVTFGAGYLTGGVTPKALFTAACGVFSLQYGKNFSKSAYASIPGPELRNVHRFTEANELQNNIPGATAAGTTVTVNIAVYVPMGAKLLRDGRIRAPGSSQMRGVNLIFQEGNALNFNGGGTNTAVRAAGNCTISVFAVTEPDTENRYCGILSYFKGAAYGLEADLNPNGILFGAWDINDKYGGNNSISGTTGQNLLSLWADDFEVLRAVQAYAIDDEYLLNYVPGSVAIDDEVTILFSPQAYQAVKELPSGKGRIRQESAYVSQIQSRGLYWPVVDSQEAADAAIATANDTKTSTLATNAPTSLPDVPTHQAGTAPIAMVPVSHPNFSLLSGPIAQPNAVSTVLSIPSTQLKAVSAAASSGGSSTKAKLSAATAVLQKITAQVPGALHAASGGNPMAAITDIGTLAGGIASTPASNAGAVSAALSKAISGGGIKAA